MSRTRLSSVFAIGLLAGFAGLSAAGATPPADPVAQRQDAGTVMVSWQAAGPVDVLVADRADAPVKAARLVAAGDRDGRALVPEAAGTRRYILLRDVRSGDVARVAERLLPLEAGSNFRDIGGYPAAGGRHVKWGLIYRSGATPRLTPADQQQIARLGLANMIDLRSDEERVVAPTRIDGVPYVAVGYSMGQLMGKVTMAGMSDGLYRGLPGLMAPHLRQIFARLLRQEGPLVYNCSAGQDRTGFVSAVILSALGTPYATIVADYHLSTAWRRPEFEMPHLTPEQVAANPAMGIFARMQDDPRARQPQPLKTAQGKPYLDFAFAEMTDRWGGVEGYLRREIGLAPRDIARLRALYTM
ncbi:tyrosine-protein phosphatase [Novosphingobium bradum]|uniref:Tyrosine-protein phosphatase n=1 Tax=Novosphingobium bradum TaxID=1737444 RepID=A0ABV7IXG8_9SPHN